MSTLPAYDPSLSGERAHTILILENEPGNRFVLDYTLRAAHYACVSADSIADAWERIQRGDISLVITDLHFGARADPLALITRMRADPRTARIPVIVATGDRSEEQRQAALDAGAGAYLFKPYDKGTLLSNIQECLAGR